MSQFRFTDPFQVHQAIWPDVYFYDKQCDQIQAFRDSVITTVVAGNELGKDFVWGFICPSFFMFPWVYFPPEYYDQIDIGMRGREDTWENFIMVHTRRMLTTSVKQEHLGVLWGEIGRFVQTAREFNGINIREHLLVTDMELRFVQEREATGTNVLNYLKGTVISKDNAGEGMAGHHAAYTAGVCDEASSMDNRVHDQWLGWADKYGYFGNAFDTQNVWRKMYEEARFNKNTPWETRGENGKLLVKAIQVKATDSPNVQYGLLERRKGRVPSNRILVPGIIDYSKFVERQNPAILDERQQCIKLGAEFWKGAEDRLVPEFWLTKADEYHQLLVQKYGPPRTRKFPRWMGIDPGEGGDDSAWVIIDRHGLIEVVSKKTSDTNEVVGMTMDLAESLDVPWDHIWFDRGGGGREHADRMRAHGYPVNDVGFGPEKAEPKRRMTFYAEKVELTGDKDSYVNKRSRMAYDLRLLTERDKQGNYVAADPGSHVFGFGLPASEVELVRQIKAVPMKWDALGKFVLIPKQSEKPDDQNTFRKLIGRSPDQFDALCLAIYGMNHKPTRGRAEV